MIFHPNFRLHAASMPLTKLSAQLFAIDDEDIEHIFTWARYKKSEDECL